MRYPGRPYHRRYGYTLWIALTAEFWWRVEHLPWSYEGQVFGPLTRLGYRKRKEWERRGSPLLQAVPPDAKQEQADA